MKNVGMLTRLLTLIGVQQKELYFLYFWCHPIFAKAYNEIMGRSVRGTLHFSSGN